MFLWARPIASVSARAADSDARASVMASDAAERCAEVLRAGARGLGGAEARASFRVERYVLPKFSVTVEGTLVLLVNIP